MKTVTEFNISVIVVTKMITYNCKFLRGVLHRMYNHERSHLAISGGFHLAILAFGKLSLFFTRSQKRLRYNFVLWKIL